MKRLNLQYLVIVTFLLTNSIIYSQSDSFKLYYTNNISIDYSAGSIKSKNLETGKINLDSYSETINDISKIKFVNDSIINLSCDNQSNLQLNINKINGISIKSGGSYLWEGAGVGALLGLGVALIVSSTDSKPKTYSTDPYGNFINGFNESMESSGKAILGFLGVITGALVGGIIGGNISGYETYEMDKYKFDKKREMERILRIDRKNK